MVRSLGFKMIAGSHSNMHPYIGGAGLSYYKAGLFSHSCDFRNSNLGQHLFRGAWNGTLELLLLLNLSLGLAWTLDPQFFGIPLYSYYRYLYGGNSRGPKCHVEVCGQKQVPCDSYFFWSAQHAVQCQIESKLLKGCYI